MMETAPNGSDMAAFLEAHYYDNGVRHLAFPQGQDRPSWAPAPDRAGIKNSDLKMIPGVVVVEYSRVATEHSEADWLGVFWPSGDQQLGNRGNYAGIGLWSQGCRYSNCKDLVDALGKISSQIAQSMGVNEKLASNILKLLNEYVPNYLEDDAALPEGILPIKAAGRIATTKVEALPFAVGDQAKLPPEVCQSIADRVMIANLTRDTTEDYSRLLIVVAEEYSSVRDGATSPLQELPDLTSRILKSVGEKSIESRKRAAQLVRENARMAEQIRGLEASVIDAQKNEQALMEEISDLREVVQNLESEHTLPPELVLRLDRIENQLHPVSSLTETIQARFHSLEDRVSQIVHSRPAQVYKNSEIRNRPVRRAPQPEPTFWESWGLIILGVVAASALIFLALTLGTRFF